MAAVKWLPLESNPEVMNQFLKYLGVPAQWGISDVFSLDEDDLLALIPQPVLAVLLLFPITAKHEEFSQKQVDDMLASGSNVNDNLFFMKQTIRNACGTVALIHSVANNLEHLKLEADSPLKKFLHLTKDMSPDDKGKELEKNMDIGSVHEACAQQGQTEAPSLDEDINLHFVAFVNLNNQLYELDGRKSVPVIHGPTSSDTFLKDAGKICKTFMELDPENVRFTVLAFGPSAS